jgi:RNA 2',3'-cyclic 3'-phosphodiesterase
MGPGALEEDPRSLRLRTFFGLPLPEPQRQELGRFIATCESLTPGFRWTPTQNLHLTIRFVGSAERSVVEVVADALAERPPAAFDLDLGGIGSFRRGAAVRVVWLGLQSGAEAAAALATRVEEECARAGLKDEFSKSHPGRRASAQIRPFRAHLTLARARARDGGSIPDLPAPPQLKPWRAEELNLYASRLTRSGAIYEVIRTLRLA